MKTIYLLRHAECEGSGYIGARSDVPLSPEGREHAKKLAERIDSLGIAMIYSSPMRRCRETIAPFTGHIPSVPVSYEDDLKELDFGSFEGMTYDQVSRHYPEELSLWMADPVRTAPPGGESLDQLHQRVRAFIDHRLLTEMSDTILVCGHGGSIRALICELLHLGPGHHWDFLIDRGNTAVVHIYEDGVAALCRLNDDRLS